MPHGQTPRAAPTRTNTQRFRWCAPSVAVVCAALTSRTALAFDGTSTSMWAGTWTVVALALGYWVLHAGLTRLRRAFPLVPGVEFLLLGVILGPLGLRVGFLDNPHRFLPLAALASAWVAFTCGTRLHLRGISGAQRGGPRLGFLSAVVSWLAVTLLAQAAVRAWIPTLPPEHTWFVCGWLGCAAAASSSAPSVALEQHYDITGKTPQLLDHSAAASNFVAVVGFGILTCVFRPGGEWNGRSLSPVELAVVSVGVGACLGVILSPYLGHAERLAGRILVLVSVVAFASGAAYWFGLSILWVNLMLGLLLINTTLFADRVDQVVHASTPPFTFVLRVLAGALWVPSPWLPTLLAVAGFVLLRWLARRVSSWFVAQWMPSMRSDAGRGLLGHGSVAIALAITLRIAQDGPLVDIGYAAILFSVILHDLVAPRGLRVMLQDAGELRGHAEGRT